MAQWGRVLPGWVWSRWVCNQAARAMHEELRDPSLDAERRAGLHAETDQVWAYRQLRLYDDGVLRFFVRRMAGSALLARSDQVEAWPQATMGGFEFIEANPSSISWIDLATARGTLDSQHRQRCLVRARRPGHRTAGAERVPARCSRVGRSASRGASRRKWPRLRPGGASSCGRHVRVEVTGCCTILARVSHW